MLASPVLHKVTQAKVESISSLLHPTAFHSSFRFSGGTSYIITPYPDSDVITQFSKFFLFELVWLILTELRHKATTGAVIPSELGESYPLASAIIKMS